MKTFLFRIETDKAQGIKVGGYNMTDLREMANLAMVTNDDNTAPLLAAWHVGLGRTAVYTGQIDGKWTGPIAAWEQYQKLLNSLSRWFKVHRTVKAAQATYRRSELTMENTLPEVIAIQMRRSIISQQRCEFRRYRVTSVKYLPRRWEK